MFLCRRERELVVLILQPDWVAPIASNLGRKHERELAGEAARTPGYPFFTTTLLFRVRPCVLSQHDWAPFDTKFLHMVKEMRSSIMPFLFVVGSACLCF